MRKISASLVLLLVLLPNVLLAQTQTVKPINPKELAQIIAAKKDSVVVLNFWATWCKPCVAELPYFEQLYQTHQGQKVSIILVSLDDPADNQRLVTPFVRKRSMHTEVYQMTEPNPNVWINDFEPNWSGAIPVTLFYAGGKKVQFHNGEITSNELTDTVDKLLRGERKND
jgi:thiol-disulfide isomerase/thioredoxin